MKNNNIKSSSICFHDYSPEQGDFVTDVIEGLSIQPKAISPKYFYDEKGEVQPIVKVRISKNKMSGFKRSIYFKFYREFCKFEECDHAEQQEHGRRG